MMHRQPSSPYWSNPKLPATFTDRVKELRDAFAANAISSKQFTDGFQSAQQAFLGFDPKPLDTFSAKLGQLSQAMSKGLISKDAFKQAALNAVPDNLKDVGRNIQRSSC